MAIVPLTKDEIVKMEKACKHAARTLEYVAKFVKPGITTLELDKIVHDYTLSTGATPAPLGYGGFPNSVCTSVNQVVCHGVPDHRALVDGDIINIDVTSKLDGFFGDTSASFLVGHNFSDKARDIIEVAMLARDKGIAAITPYGHTGDIGFETQKFVTRRGYTTVRDIGGHGVGRKFHEEPFVPSWGKKGKGEKLIPWHCITVEPMINEGTEEVTEHEIPGSNIKYYETADGLLSAQFEHTVLVTDKGYEILTVP